jgi:hypothetical protein
VTDLALNEAVLLAHAAVARAAGDHDVRVLFIKGPVAARQGLRGAHVSLDVDALVDPARASILSAVLTDLGWVDEHAYTTPTAATYSHTHRHSSWPCELDLHDRFPGFFAAPQDAFERLWAHREYVEVAAIGVPCPDPRAHALVLALNALRDPHAATKVGQLSDLVRRVSGSFDEDALLGLAELALDLGAADTAAPFLSAVGAPGVGIGSTAAEDLRAWRLRTQPAWRVATWIDGLRHRPMRSWPRYLWYAVALSDHELRLADPGLPDGRRALMTARWRRLKRGAAALPSAVLTVRQAGRSNSRNPIGQTRLATTRTTWRSALVPRALAAPASAALGLLDRGLIWKRGVLIRTFPDFDDQGMEMARALTEAGVKRLVWLVKSPPSPSNLQRLPPGTRVVDAGSLRGALEYALARVVVHTHGLYGIPARSRRKIFVNLWHGWGTKQLHERPLVGMRQSDMVAVTSAAHADAVAAAWGIDRARVKVTGLPRNDVMVRAAVAPRPGTLEQVVGGRPLVLWLPTYRRSIVGELRTDGREFDNDFQFPRCQRADVQALAEDLGVHMIVKTHPMSETRDPGDRGSLCVWDDRALAATGLTLYELLGHADVLVTDYSSVWVDYLLIDRPIVFTMADLEEYAATRGHYGSAAPEAELPGPIVRDMAALRAALAEALEDSDHWAARRRELRALHHAHVDARSGARLTALVGNQAMSGRTGRRAP